MIWIDASFAVEWLLGLPRASRLSIPAKEDALILPLQYAEVCAFFLRRDPDFPRESLDALTLTESHPHELLDGAALYVHARGKGSKASLADAVLAACVRSRGGDLYSFDEDFRSLGLRAEKSGLWRLA